MGRLIYGSGGESFDIDDRLLAHLRVVFMNKLRRSEPFMFHRADSVGTRSLWIHPSMPFVFHFYGSRQPAINRAWIEQMIIETSSVHGLTVQPEPNPARESSLV